MHVDMEDTDFDVEVPLLFNQGYECSQNQEVEVPGDDDVGVESLDFDPIYNVVNEKLKKRQFSRKFYGYYTTKTLHAHLNSVKRIHSSFSPFMLSVETKDSEYYNYYGRMFHSK